MNQIAKTDLFDDERAEFRSIFHSTECLKMSSIPERFCTLLNIDLSCARDYVRRLNNRVRIPALSPQSRLAPVLTLPWAADQCPRAQQRAWAGEHPCQLRGRVLRHRVRLGGAGQGAPEPGHHRLRPLPVHCHDLPPGQRIHPSGHPQRRLRGAPPLLQRSARLPQQPLALCRARGE